MKKHMKCIIFFFYIHEKWYTKTREINKKIMLSIGLIFHYQGRRKKDFLLRIEKIYERWEQK